MFLTDKVFPSVILESVQVKPVQANPPGKLEGVVVAAVVVEEEEAVVGEQPLRTRCV